MGIQCKSREYLLTACQRQTETKFKHIEQQTFAVDNVKIWPWLLFVTIAVLHCTLGIFYGTNITWSCCRVRICVFTSVHLLTCISPFDLVIWISNQNSGLTTGLNKFKIFSLNNITQTWWLFDPTAVKTENLMEKLKLKMFDCNIKVNQRYLIALGTNC